MVVPFLLLDAPAPRTSSAAGAFHFWPAGWALRIFGSEAANKEKLGDAVAMGGPEHAICGIRKPH